MFLLFWSHASSLLNCPIYLKEMAMQKIQCGSVLIARGRRGILTTEGHICPGCCLPPFHLQNIHSDTHCSSILEIDSLRGSQLQTQNTTKQAHTPKQLQAHDCRKLCPLKQSPSDPHCSAKDGKTEVIRTNPKSSYKDLDTDTQIINFKPACKLKMHTKSK
jgi:hypothetical protein